MLVLFGCGFYNLTTCRLLPVLLLRQPLLCVQGTLRDALDSGQLLRGGGAGCSTGAPRLLAPALAVGLAQDVAAAMVHLHGKGACTAVCLCMLFPFNARPMQLAAAWFVPFVI
jgi:hypothetical protein